MKKQLSHRNIRRSLAGSVEKLLAATTPALVFEPHSYQRETYERMVEWLKNPRGGRRRYVAHATGLGKTFEFVMLALFARELTFLIVVPNKNLIVQTAREIRALSKGEVEVGHISSLPSVVVDPKTEEVLATKGFEGKRIVIVTQDSLRGWAKRLATEFKPNVVIRDECHWAYTDLQVEALNHFEESVIIAYSATPDYLTTTAKPSYVPVTLDNGQVLYADPKRLADTHFEKCLHRMGLRNGIADGYLAPLAWGELGVTLNLDEVSTTDGPLGMDYDQQTLIATMERSWPAILEVIRRLYEDNTYDIRNRQVAAVCPSIKCAEEFAAVVNQYAPAKAVVGTVKDDERQRILDVFDAEDDEEVDEVMRAVSSVFMLREGWNSRKAEILFMLRPTRSRVFYEQALGRVLRKFRNGREKVALVIDPHYQAAKFAPLSAPVLYGTPGEAVTSGGILLGPRGSRGKKKFISPYIPTHVRPTIRIVQAIEIEYWAGDDGLVVIDGEWWGTLTSLAQKLGLHSATITARLGSCSSRPGKDQGGRTVTLYALKDVRKACKDLLDTSLLQAGEDGTIEADGDTWGIAQAICQKLGLSNTTLFAHLDVIRSRSGKSSFGRRVTLYALADVKKACKDLLDKNLIQVGKDGTVKADGRTWGTIRALARKISLSKATVASRLDSSWSYRLGKDGTGKRVTLYALKDVQKACKDLLDTSLLQAGEDGTIEADGDTWGTVRAFTRKIGLGKRTITARLGSCSSRPGKDQGGRTVTLYALKDVRKACKDLLDTSPLQVDKDGTVKADGETWGTRPILAKKVGLSPTAIKPHIRSFRSRPGKDKIGHRVTLYALADVKKACAKILTKKYGK